MADMQVDTSSYPKPVAGQNFLDTANKFQQLESNKLTIGRQKLDLINQQFQNVSKGLAGLANKPDLNEQDVTGFLQNGVKEGWLPADMAGTEISQIPSTQGMPPAKATATLKDWANQKLSMGQNVNDAINFHYGTPGSVSTGNQIVPTVSSPKFGTQQTQPGIPTQPPPTTPTVAAPNSGLPAGTPTLLGPSAPSQVLPPAPQASTSALPVGPRQVSGPIQGVGNVTGAEVGPDQPNMGLPAGAGLPTRAPVQTQSFNKPIQTGLAPGIAAPMEASGQQLANDRLAAASYQRDIFPLMQAIPDLEKLGTKGTGPGTATINQLKSFVLSNVPGVKESDFNGTVADYDKANKYLTDFVNQTGNSGTNDKLAAAFAGNPSTHISNAAAVDVAKSALALRRMKQAQLLTFEQSGQPASEYSKWVAQTTNQLDPRAFGVDMMTPQAKQKLLAQLNKNPTEKANFEKSVSIAHNLNFITPPAPEANQ